MFGAAWAKSANVGARLVGEALSCTIWRRSAWSAAGNFWNPASRAALRSAVASPAVLALRMKPATLARSRASGARTRSEFAASLASSWFWLRELARGCGRSAEVPGRRA